MIEGTAVEQLESVQYVFLREFCSEKVIRYPRSISAEKHRLGPVLAEVLYQHYVVVYVVFLVVK
jgi:hypothetical protein